MGRARKGAFFSFFIFQVAYPISYMILGSYPEWYAISYIVPVVVSSVCFVVDLRPSLKEFLEIQLDFLFGYAFTIMCLYFNWWVNDLKGFHANHRLIAAVSQITVFLSSFVYSIIVSKPLSNIEFGLIMVSTLVRLSYYSYKCSNYIQRKDYDPVLKDFQLIVQATIIAVYGYYLSEVQKAWQKHRKHVPIPSLLSEM